MKVDQDGKVWPLKVTCVVFDGFSSPVYVSSILICCLVELAQVVTVETDKWRKRTTKVLNQAKPQLEEARELYREGQKRGFGGTGKDRSFNLSWVTQ